ncbi:MAG TPA: TonB C-terminal domain-containing protein [Acidobacteriaceae bacterium]|nr:TonB C-terminal domain-containing protein [Acidobacteriaceae bacterium]
MLFTETPIEPEPPSANAPPPPPRRPPPPPPRRVLAGRHGEWETHELIRLLDTIEDERARGRFRESLYISLFVWLAVAWFVVYGPRVLWHAPQLRDRASVQRELTQLRMAPLPRVSIPAIKPVQPTIDSKTMERLREAEPRPAPAPPTPAPQPAAAQPIPPPPPPPVTTNAPRVPPPVVAEAPTAQRTFTKAPSAGNAIQQALDAAAHDRSGGGVGNVGGRRPGPQSFGGQEILSDTQGVDFNPYLRRVLGDIQRNWEPLLPPEAGSPLFKQGETYIRFTILPDGSIKSASMHLDGSTHDIAIDKSCWNAITSEGQFPPLPKNFHGPELTLRLDFLTNKELPE